MQLDILEGKQWYADSGLSFTCTQCGNCCTGGPGVVWISLQEIARLAEHFKITPEETVERYCRKVDGRFSLRERRNRLGQYDCLFLVDRPGVVGEGPGDVIRQPVRGCSIYPVRPLQCRTWPFWPENLATEDAWKAAGSKCPGMDRGRKFSRHQIETLRDAEDWPARPPSSGGKK